MVIKNDTFTITGGDIALETRTSDSGGGWGGADTANFDVIDATNAVLRDGDGTVLMAMGDEAPSSADYYVTANGEVVNDANWAVDGFGPAVRVVDANNGYYVQLLRGTGTAGQAKLRLFKRVSGTHTQIGSDYTIPSGFSGATNYAVKLQCEGTSLKVYLDTVLQIDETDSALSAAGEIGIAGRNSDPLITSVYSDYLTVAHTPFAALNGPMRGPLGGRL